MNLALNVGVTRCVNATISQNQTTLNKRSPSVQKQTWDVNCRRQALVDVLRDGADKRSLDATKCVHGFVLKSEFSDSDALVLFNHVAHAYVKCMDFVSARQVFDEMPHRNVFSYTVMISGYTENGLFLDGFELFREMLCCGIWPDEFTYSSVLQTCIGLDRVGLGRMVHAQIVQTGFWSQSFVAASLLNMYAKLGSIRDSRKVFGTIVEHNQVSWNAMISGYTLNGLHSEAYKLFLEMKDREIGPNNLTIVSVSKAVGQLGNADMARAVHSYASELGLDSSILVGTALIDMLWKCKSLDEARLIFDSNFSGCRANPPWNAMISGYSQSEHSHDQEEAVKLFEVMLENGIWPDVYTYCSIFNAIASLKLERLAREVHSMALKSGSGFETGVSNAIADAYMKCEVMEDARKVFDRMEERDVVSWTTLVAGCTRCSDYEGALSSFMEMREEGFVPNHFTLSTAIDACAGLSSPDLGRQLHGLVCKSGLGLEKCNESSLIDMYSKCGHMSEARNVFERISDPDTVSWTAIISACAHHGLAEDALQYFERMERSGAAKVTRVTFLCILFACSHGGLVNEGVRIFHRMKDFYGIVPEMEHYACVVDLLGRVGRLSEAMEFIQKMPVEPNEIVWQTLLGACRVHRNVELGEFAAGKILAVRPDYSGTYVLLSNTYIEAGSHEVGVGLRNLMKERGVRKEPGCSWISVRGRVHRFYAGDQLNPGKDPVHAKLKELSDAIKLADYAPDLSYE